MSKVAQITEHAGILYGTPFACLIRLVTAVGTDKGKYSLEDGRGKLEPWRKGATSLGSVVVVIVTGIVESVLVALLVFLSLL